MKVIAVLPNVSTLDVYFHFQVGFIHLSFTSNESILRCLSWDCMTQFGSIWWAVVIEKFVHGIPCANRVISNQYKHVVSRLDPLRVFHRDLKTSDAHVFEISIFTTFPACLIRKIHVQRTFRWWGTRCLPYMAAGGYPSHFICMQLPEWQWYFAVTKHNLLLYCLITTG